MQNGSPGRKKLKIASLIITYNRVDEARAQMDIIRELWEPILDRVDIYHEFNGKPKWYPKIYREDYLHKHKPMSHFIGASHMFNQGMKHILESGEKYDFIIASSADTWFYDLKKLKTVLLSCRKNHYQLVASLWSGMILGTEFFIITPDLAKKIFPIRLSQFLSKNKASFLLRNKASFLLRNKASFLLRNEAKPLTKELRSLRNKILRWTNSQIARLFECIFTLQVIRHLKNPKKIYLLPGREIIWLFGNRYFSPSFYASHHDKNQRKADLSSELPLILGEKMTNMPALTKFFK